MQSAQASEQLFPEQKRAKAREIGLAFTARSGGERVLGGKRSASATECFPRLAPLVPRSPHLFFVLNWRRDASACVRSGAKRGSRCACPLAETSALPLLFSSTKKRRKKNQVRQREKIHSSSFPLFVSGKKRVGGPTLLFLDSDFKPHGCSRASAVPWTQAEGRSIESASTQRRRGRGGVVSFGFSSIEFGSQFKKLRRTCPSPLCAPRAACCASVAATCSTFFR